MSLRYRYINDMIYVTLLKIIFVCGRYLSLSKDESWAHCPYVIKLARIRTYATQYRQ